MNPQRPLLILKTGQPPVPLLAEFGEFELWMARAMKRPVERLRTVESYQGESLPNPEEISGVVVTGSPAMVTARADWSEASGRWLAEVVRNDALPVLGVCYGHQLLAHALGGRVGDNPNGREIGTFDVVHASKGSVEMKERTPLFREDAFLANFSHSESVLELPPNAKVLAASALEPHAVIAFGPRQWGVQFHPEFDEPIMRGYLEARRTPITEEGTDVDALIANVRETPDSAKVLERFAEFTEAQSALAR